MLRVFKYTASVLTLWMLRWLFLEFGKVKIVEKGKTIQIKWGTLVFSSLILTLYFPNNGCLPPVINMSSSRSRTRRMGWPVLKKTNFRFFFHCTHPFIHLPIIYSSSTIHLCTYPFSHLTLYRPIYPSPIHPATHMYSIRLTIHPSLVHSLSAYGVLGTDMNWCTTKSLSPPCARTQCLEIKSKDTNVTCRLTRALRLQTWPSPRSIPSAYPCH